MDESLEPQNMVPNLEEVFLETQRIVYFLRVLLQSETNAIVVDLF